MAADHHPERVDLRLDVRLDVPGGIVHDQLPAPPGAGSPHHGQAEPVLAAGEMLERSEVAAQLHVSERTVRRLVDAGDLEEVRVAPQSPRITADSLARHLARNGRRTAVSAA